MFTVFAYLKNQDSSHNLFTSSFIQVGFEGSHKIYAIQVVQNSKIMSNDLGILKTKRPGPQITSCIQASMLHLPLNFTFSIVVHVNEIKNVSFFQLLK